MGGGGAPAGAVASQARAAAQEALANMTFAETIPVIQGMAVDAEGRLWLRRAGDREYDRGAIDVVTADGRYLGTLRAGTRIPNAFGPDRRAAYIETDDLGIQRVTVARLADWRE
jgi:sugar lactone lactonase YvrE